MNSDDAITTPTEKPKPTLVLMRGNAMTVENVRIMFEALTGKKMSPDEIESIRRRLSRE